MEASRLGMPSPETVEFSAPRPTACELRRQGKLKETSQCDLSSCAPTQGIGITACASSE